MTEPNVPTDSSPLPPPPLWRRIIGFPSTRLGQWSLVAVFVFFVLLAIFFALVASGEGGGATFFSNPLMAGLLIAAGIAGVAGGVLALVAIVWKGERSLLVFAVLLLGLFVLFFAVGEIAGHD